MKIYTNDDETIVVGKNNKEDYIVKYDSEFYKIPQRSLEELCDIKSLKLKKEILDKPYITIIMLAVILGTIFLFFIKEKYVIIDSNFLLANIILVLNIFLHELGHMIFLKSFYRDGRIKLGFKLFFIYPAFYVDTSDSYLLPKYKKISVYLAGNFFNSIYILFCMIFIPEINKYNYIVISTILINFLPIVKSDGYYALISMWDKYIFFKGKTRGFIDDTIRGVIMFIFLYLLSKIQIQF